MGKQDLSICRWVVYRFKIPQTTGELETWLNNTLVAAAQLGKVVLTKMYTVCDREFIVTYLVCPQ